MLGVIVILDEGSDTAVTAVDQTRVATAPPAEAGLTTRRRGAVLEDAILSAALAELTDVGYTSFTVESVAARARTGKASIYRRWPTKQLLVMDAMSAAMPAAEHCGLDFRFIDSVTTAQALHEVARRIADTMTSPLGDAIRAIKCESATDPELADLVDERFQAPRRAALIGLLRRGVARGEVRPDAATAVVADVLPAVLMHRILMLREPVTEAVVVQIMDQVLIPLVECRPATL